MELRCRVFMGLAAPLILLAVAWGLSLWGVPAHDPDLGWHLLGGRWILEHGAVPRADFINLFRREWHDYHWLAQVLLAWVYEHGGYTLLRVTLGLLGVALFLALVGLALRARRGTLSPYTTLIVLSGFVLIQEIATIRPQMLALLLLALASILLSSESTFTFTGFSFLIFGSFTELLPDSSGVPRPRRCMPGEGCFCLEVRALSPRTGSGVLRRIGQVCSQTMRSCGTI